MSHLDRNRQLEKEGTGKGNYLRVLRGYFISTGIQGRVRENKTPNSPFLTYF